MLSALPSLDPPRPCPEHVQRSFQVLCDHLGLVAKRAWCVGERDNVSSASVVVGRHLRWRPLSLAWQKTLLVLVSALDMIS